MLVIKGKTSEWILVSMSVFLPAVRQKKTLTTNSDTNVLLCLCKHTWEKQSLYNANKPEGQ